MVRTLLCLWTETRVTSRPVAARVTQSQAAPESVGSILIGHFGARSQGGKWDFSNARTLVLYCNGMWCSQSTNAVKLLLHYGYPAQKLKWYRGGMQNWENLGLTTVKLKD